MIPILHNLDDETVGLSFLKFIFPIGLLVLNLFLCVFEGILNGYAELTHFGDRLFYLVPHCAEQLGRTSGTRRTSMNSAASGIVQSTSS